MESFGQLIENKNRTKVITDQMYVPKAGLEPARGFPHCPLKTACLPVPPLRLKKFVHILNGIIKKTDNTLMKFHELLKDDFIYFTVSFGTNSVTHNLINIFCKFHSIYLLKLC